MRKKRYESQKAYRLDPSIDASSIALWLSTGETPEDAVLADVDPEWLLSAVLDALVAQLREEHRDVINLLMSGVLVPHEEADSGYRRAARQLGIDHKTVKRRLTAAVEELQQLVLTVPYWARFLLQDRLPLPEPKLKADIPFGGWVDADQ